MLWIKSLHIIFVTSWFAGLFYLPRLFVNLSMVSEDSQAERARLLIMARKLLRFATILMLPALAFGVALVWAEGLLDSAAVFAQQGWLHAKLVLVMLSVAYHFYCARHVRHFELGIATRSHVWYRWFNEIPVIFLSLIVVLVVVKPF